MSETQISGDARIGPNAVLQLLPQIEKLGGAGRVHQLLAEAGLESAPDGHDMIPEGQAVRLHQVLRRKEPQHARAVSVAAGRDTAAYILRHRIPAPAQRFLKAMPGFIAANLLSKAIERHAWTFVGSGQFRRLNAWTFQISDNPMVRGETSAVPLCTWHASVFEHLYRELVHPDVFCHETSCCAQGPKKACVFKLRLTDRPI